MNQTFVQLNDVRLHVAHGGSEHDECIIFLHGFPESHLSWKPYLSEFSESHCVVAPDNRGFGESEKPPHLADYDMQKIVADVVGLAKYFSAEPITLVGHDWGGITAWNVAAQYPELLKRLVILNAPHPTIFRQTLADNHEQRAASQYINRLRNIDCESRIQALGLETFWMSLFGAHLALGAITSADKAKQLNTWREPGALTAMLSWYRASSYDVPALGAAFVDDPKPPLAKILVPTLVIWGMQDTLLLPCQLASLSSYVSFLTIKTLNHAGHGLIHESPREIIALMREFIGVN